ncbi:hypothetical protein V8J88_02160 [Massilia sp. W12]|uniref:hypothetical protein n=1 Tax=Massilia sp. W12 TaxID=3126507 RepID=UPI0030D036F0
MSKQKYPAQASFLFRHKAIQKVCHQILQQNRNLALLQAACAAAAWQAQQELWPLCGQRDALRVQLAQALDAQADAGHERKPERANLYQFTHDLLDVHCTGLAQDGRAQLRHLWPAYFGADWPQHPSCLSGREQADTAAACRRWLAAHPDWHRVCPPFIQLLEAVAHERGYAARPDTHEHAEAALMKAARDSVQEQKWPERQSQALAGLHNLQQDLLGYLQRSGAPQLAVQALQACAGDALATADWCEQQSAALAGWQWSGANLHQLQAALAAQAEQSLRASAALLHAWWWLFARRIDARAQICTGAQQLSHQLQDLLQQVRSECATMQRALTLLPQPEQRNPWLERAIYGEAQFQH